MQNEIKVDDEFILHKGDAKFKIVIYNVNYYRPPRYDLCCTTL